jgi:kynurenine formamidase
MKTTFEIGDRVHKVDLNSPIDISIPLIFDGPQPNAFGVGIASAEELGDTREESSVNFERYTLVPHCNGTHTECVGHITHERISVLDCLKDTFVPAVLISVGPTFANEDLVISEDQVRSGLARVPHESFVYRALIVRTLPNDNSKLTRVYDADYIPPYFTEDALKLIVEKGFRHLLVDLPSIDRLFDDGKLSNHRIFWTVEPGKFEVSKESRVNSTITELIYIPNEISDGEYLLNLQIAPFASDASPSRPLLFRLEAN